MGLLMVVAVAPVLGHAPDFVQAGVDVDPQQLAVEIVVDVKVRKRRPDHSASAMKSADPVWLAWPGISKGLWIRSGKGRLPRCGRLSFMAT